MAFSRMEDTKPCSKTLLTLLDIRPQNPCLNEYALFEVARILSLSLHDSSARRRLLINVYRASRYNESQSTLQNFTCSVSFLLSLGACAAFLIIALVWISVSFLTRFPFAIRQTCIHEEFPFPSAEIVFKSLNRLSGFRVC